MEQSGQPPEIFSRRRRRALHERATRRTHGSFLFEHIAVELSERLNLVSRDFQNALVIGPISEAAGRIMGERNGALSLASISNVEEDRLAFNPASFDLIISAGTLDSVNDLPGALAQIRRILKPDGLFLGHMFGAGSLAALKSLMMAAEGAVAAPHIHPQIELRSAADLLSRAGFALPVADIDMIHVRYADWRSIVDDIRDVGIGNALAGPRHYLGRDMLSRLDTEWKQRADKAGKVEESFAHLFLSGWAPSPDQPKPAKRGSGISLASILPSAEKH